MADDEKNKQTKENKQEKPAGGADRRSLIGRLLPWTVIIVVVAVSAGAGFGLGRIFARSATPDPSDPNAPKPAAAGKTTPAENDPEKTLLYEDLPTVVATLNEPGLTRYLRVTLMLKLFQRETADSKAVVAGKSAELVNWLNLFLASQTLEDVRGDRNLRRLQMQILDAFNQVLAPNAKPLIKEVYFKDIAIQ
ncbi:MAG TPA: flagellar basal body-associated FliL family protein [Phycisphaerales bacterium]|nr:flagellar basal body-associated FliL family protein [Phycisphaerales bacterium]